VLSRPSTAVLFLGALSPFVVSCGGDAGTDSSSSATTVAVAAGDETCDVERTEFEAGAITFAVENEGSSTTEVYVYGDNDGEFTKVVAEVENIGPGTSRNLDVDLPGGSYEIACKPGQSGDGIRTPITVSGGAGEATEGGAEEEAGYDREIELSTDGTTITGLDGGAESGERIEFKLTNQADGPRTLELKDPDGGVAAEVEVEQGATGEVVVDLDAAGTWQVIVEGAGIDDLVEELPVA
jgi:iron uptake system component EfeO